MLRECPGRGPGGSPDDPVPRSWAKVETGGWPGRGREGDKSPSPVPWEVGIKEEGPREGKTRAMGRRNLLDAWPRGPGPAN